MDVSFLFNILYIQNTIAAPSVHKIPVLMLSAPFHKRSMQTPIKAMHMASQPNGRIFSLYNLLQTIAVMIGVDAIMTLEVADVIVSIPVLKKIRYKANPQIPAADIRSKSLTQNGLRILRNFPAISRATEATMHLISPRQYGEKLSPAIFVAGNAAAHKATVMNAKIFSLALLLMIIAP